MFTDYTRTLLLNISTLACGKAEIWPDAQEYTLLLQRQNHSGITIFTYCIHKILC